MQKVAIEISEKQYEKLEAIARWKSHQEGRTVSVEELIRIAVERHMERLYGKQKKWNDKEAEAAGTPAVFLLGKESYERGDAY